MTTVKFANSSGIYSGVIGWIDFGAGSIASGGSRIVTNTLPNNSTISFTLTNTNVSGSPSGTYQGSQTFWAAPFMGSRYTGIGGNIIIYKTAFSSTATFTLSNITLTDALGNIVKDFEFVVADAEITGTADNWVATTDGGNWSIFEELPNVSGDSTKTGVSGIGTKTVTEGNFPPLNYAANIYKTDSPTQVSVTLGPAPQAFAVGITVYPSAKYANSTSATYARRVAWIDFSPGRILTGETRKVRNILKENAVIEFTFTQATQAGSVSSNFYIPPTWSGSSFGNSAYTGINGNVALYATGSGNARYTLSNIKVVDSLGNTIPNYSIIIADAEQSNNNEVWNIQTDGDNWEILEAMPAASGYPNLTRVTGLGTKIVSQQISTGTLYAGNLYVTDNPSNITINIDYNEGFAIGVVLTKLALQADITSRIAYADQFNLSLVGTPSVTTTTSGNIYGIQNTSTIWGKRGNIYTINESMGSGSENYIGNYISTLKLDNATVGGTNVTAINTIGSAVTLSIGDYITVTIKNTFTIPSVITTKTVDKQKCVVGDTLSYTISVKNTGSYKAINFVMIDTVPSALTLVAGTVVIDGTATTANPNSLMLGTLPVGGVSTVTFKAIVNTVPSPSNIKNDASSTYTGSGIGASNSNTSVTTVNYVILDVVKSADKTYSYVGDTISYNITINNKGNTTANNTIITDTLPSTVTFVSDSLKVNNITQNGISINSAVNVGTLSIGLSTINFKTVVTSLPSLNKVNNSVYVNYNYTGDIGNSNINSDGLSSNTAVTTINSAILATTKAVNKNYVSLGDEITYTVILNNDGNTTANNVTLLDTIPSGTSFVANSLTLNGVTKTGLNPSSSVNFGTLPIGISTVTFKVTVSTIPTSNKIDNSANIAYSFTVNPSVPNGISRSINTNISTVTVNYAKVQGFKTVDKSYVDSGEELNYTIRLVNTGNVAANNIVITDTLPIGLRFKENSLTINNVSSNGTLSSINVGSIGAGAVSTVFFKAIVEK